MKLTLIVVLSAFAGFLLAVAVLGLPDAARAGGAPCASRNGDVNADGRVDLSDAVTILGNLFLGSPTTLVPLCAPPADTPRLAATGQAACWGFDGDQGLWLEVPCGEAACAGQDGSRAVGCPVEGRFVDHEDGTVTDICTGLVWQKDTADVNGDGLIDPLGDTLAWCEALSYCDGLSFAGHDDWRLPNVRELQSLVDYGRSNPAIDPAFGTLLEFYWSSTSNAETANDAWGVGFHVGYVGIRVKSGDFDFSFNYVRAVRGGR
ncbi:MAG: DUF1566 domain-containing protein [Planctomycetes bacterium]|nr:DUF1566 domain-containing protein [Planctomycetota bacterium]